MENEIERQIALHLLLIYDNLKKNENEGETFLDKIMQIIKIDTIHKN